MPQSLAILGGTFDPIHIGHLCMGEWVLNHLGLNRVIYMPTGVSPHKKGVSSTEHRLKMLALATQPEPRFEVSRFEIDKPTKSYTIETLVYVAKKYGAKPYFIMGWDSIESLHTWHRYQELGEYAQLLVIPRVSEQVQGRGKMLAFIQAHLPNLESSIQLLEMPLLNISSTQLRQTLAQGDSCRYFFTSEVWDYIQKQNLYIGES